MKLKKSTTMMKKMKMAMRTGQRMELKKRTTMMKEMKMTSVHLMILKRGPNEAASIFLLPVKH